MQTAKVDEKRRKNIPSNREGARELTNTVVSRLRSDSLSRLRPSPKRGKTHMGQKNELALKESRKSKRFFSGSNPHETKGRAGGGKKNTMIVGGTASGKLIVQDFVGASEKKNV